MDDACRTEQLEIEFEALHGHTSVFTQEGL